MNVPTRRRQALTLSLYLNMLITRYTLPEVLDRLRDTIEDQSQLPGNQAQTGNWEAIAELLDQATDKALEIETVEGQCGVW